MNKVSKTPGIATFLENSSPHTLALFHHFVNEFAALGAEELYPAKTMIGVLYNGARIAWITQLGKNFIHVVFPFDKPYDDNSCFIKIRQVPGTNQFNHHFRMLFNEDVNEEVIAFMKKAAMQ